MPNVFGQRTTRIKPSDRMAEVCSAVSVLLVDTQVPTLLVQEVLGKDHAHCLFLYGTPL